MIGNTSGRQKSPRLSWRVGRFIAFIALTILVVALGLYQVHERHKLIELGYVLDDDRFEQQQRLRPIRK